MRAQVGLRGLCREGIVAEEAVVERCPEGVGRQCIVSLLIEVCDRFEFGGLRSTEGDLI